MQYSRGTLTHNTDKLVAIRGIANWVRDATGDQLVAGLWRSRIIEELCWFRPEPIFATVEWRAPTWSWVSYNGKIHHSLLFKFHRGHPNRQIDAELFELNVRSKTSGELEDASMKIKCRPLQAIFAPAVASIPADTELQGSLELIDQDGEIL